MIIDLNLLKRLIKRFGILPISKMDPKVQKVLQSNEHFIKAPAGFEPLITGGGYEWDDALNGYKLGEGQKMFLLPNGIAIWIFKDTLARALPPDSIQKWVSADTEYPMGKANAFFIVYGKLTGQDLGQNETAGDNIQPGEQDPEDGGGLAMADDENAPPFSKDDIQKMLKGEFPQDAGGQSASMDTAVPGGEPGTGHVEPKEPVGMGSPPLARLSKGEPKQNGDEADLIIKTLYKKAKVNPNLKLSKQNPIRLDADEILDIYQRAKTLPPEQKEKLIAFLKSGAVQPLEEGKISKANLQALMEHIVSGIVHEVEKAKSKSKAKKTESKPKDQDFKNGNARSKPEAPGHSQMDWEPSAEQPSNNRDNSQHIDKWIEAMANKLWKDPQEIGKGQYAWRIRDVKRRPDSTVYLVQKSKHVQSSRVFANMKGRWFYFNPEADVQDRKWKPVEETPPGEEPSIEQEQSVAAAAGPVTGPNAFRKKETPLEEMTTSVGGGGSSEGTPGYLIPGAFAGEGGSKAGVAGSAALGYTLTPVGKQDMKRKADKLYESITKSLKYMLKGSIRNKKRNTIQEASGLGADFDRAQRQYDNQMPPEENGLTCPSCGGERGYYTDKGNRSGAFWWNAECPECGHQWGDDNFDSIRDR